MQFDAPVGTAAERASAAVWPGAWMDLTGFGAGTINAYIQNRNAYHTGADLNLPALRDSGAPVYCSADGVVEYVGVPSAAWGLVILVAHPAAGVWTRYAHVKNATVKAGQPVERGQQLASIGDYAPLGDPAGDHLHFDVAKVKIAPGDWPGMDLARLMATYHDPRNWIATHREDESMANGDPRIDYERVYHVLGQDATLADWLKVCEIAYKAKQTVGFSWDDAAGTKITKRTIIAWNVATDKRQAFVDFVAQYYAGAVIEWRSTTAPTPTPTPTPTSAFRVGFNAMMNTALAREEASRGCKYFLIMDDFGGAGNLKRAHPDAVVMARRYFPQNFFLSPDQVLQGLEGAQHGALVYTGFNEADQGGQDGQELRERARIDVAVARKIKEKNPGAIYAAGTFSMGTPDFTNPETCQIIREEYAPHYNSGLLALDMHLYSPNPKHIDNPANWQWFERRWEFLFTRCGFDPTRRAIYCGENGVDQGGVGGYAAHGLNAQQVGDHVRKMITVQSLPLVVNGKAYPSPILGAAIFQLGGNGDPRWAGYNVFGYLDAIRPLYSYVPVVSKAPANN